MAWVAEQAKKAELVTSVCTGSFILAEAGLLDGKSSATHQMFLKEMQGQYPKVTVVAGKRGEVHWPPSQKDGSAC